MIAPLAEFVGAALDAQRKVVGICFGHQSSRISSAVALSLRKSAGGWASIVPNFSALKVG